ncbi:vacuolar protein-sorting-associated protein 25 isoform X2 [Oncorhynchus kisutch]|uniref:vacuolar protein-sorting-associated protein 25 isoform X2 n=1 Tax=Oncorhynchus kisutch TaxID=8019 RepID=UPI0012DD93A1|nr:vacuolar protein-sorting-associated protein 25 isoform X2 [Oncorhynchus kisutch]
MLTPDRNSLQHGAPLLSPTAAITSSTLWTSWKSKSALCSTTRILIVSFYSPCSKFHLLTYVINLTNPKKTRGHLWIYCPVIWCWIVTLKLWKGNLEWLDKNKTQCLVMWRRPEEWGKLIYQWVSKNGMVNTVFTLYELANGDDTESEEFHGLEEWMLIRSLQALQTDGKAEVITMDDGKGVKFF